MMGEVGQPWGGPEVNPLGGKGVFFIPLLRFFKADQYGMECSELTDKQNETKMGLTGW